MKIKEGIEKSIEGGYRSQFVSVKAQTKFIPQDYAEILLDPDFWKCLGKSEGWAGIGTADIPQSHYSPDWLRNMHKFIDNIAEGQDISTAFDNATK